MATRVANRAWAGQEQRAAYTLLGPALVAMLLINLYPVAYAFWVSLHGYDLKRPNRFPFVGLDNLGEVAQSSYFQNALAHTLQFSIAAVVGVTVLGLLAGLVLNEHFRGQPWMYAIFLIPWAVPNVANGIMWKWIYDGSYGALNGALYSLGLIQSYQPMLSDPGRALWLVTQSYVWKELPLAGILFLTTLKSIPHDLYEAAKVDGASAIARFLHVTLPQLKPAIMLVLIYETVGALRTFDIIYVLTEGGPGDATSTLAWYTYVESFRNLNFGRGSALAFLGAIATFLLAVWYIRLLGESAERDVQAKKEREALQADGADVAA